MIFYYAGLHSHRKAVELLIKSKTECSVLNSFEPFHKRDGVNKGMALILKGRSLNNKESKK